MAAGLLSGCAGAPEPSPELLGTTERPAAEPLFTGSRPDDAERLAAFFQMPSAATEAEHYDSLEQAVESADLVVVGRLPAMTRTVQTTYGPLPVADLEVLRTLKGEAPADLPLATVAAPPEGLPDVPAVWVLRYRGDGTGLWMLVNSQGIFAQGPDHVLSPTELGAHPQPDDEAVVGAHRFATLGDLAQHLRALPAS